MSTKNNPGNFDCYANAAPDEPMFVLLARDPIAPILVRIWACMYAFEKRKQQGHLTEAQMAKELDAYHCSLKMEEYVNKGAHAKTPEAFKAP